MFELERISKDAIPAALEKAMRYRLLNEPLQSECICLDILEVEPQNQQALVTLLLARKKPDAIKSCRAVNSTIA